MNADQGAGFILLLVLLGFYFLPWVIGFSRGVAHPWLLFLGNLLFGVSVVGWFIALVYAVASQRDRQSAHRTTSEVMPRMPRRRIEPYLTIVALSLTLGLAHQARATEEWYIAAWRFHSCDKISEHFTALHTPEQVQATYRRSGTNFTIEHPRSGVAVLANIVDGGQRMTFFRDQGMCEADMATVNRMTGYKTW